MTKTDADQALNNTELLRQTINRNTLMKMFHTKSNSMSKRTKLFVTKIN